MWSSVGIDDDDKTDIVVDGNFKVEQPTQKRQDLVSMLTTTNTLPSSSISQASEMKHPAMMGTSSQPLAVPAAAPTLNPHHHRQAHEQPQRTQPHRTQEQLRYEQRRHNREHDTSTPPHWHNPSTQADTASVVAAAVTTAQQKKQLQSKGQLFGSFTQKLMAGVAVIICFIVTGTFVALYAPFKKYKIHQRLQTFMSDISSSK